MRGILISLLSHVVAQCYKYPTHPKIASLIFVYQAVLRGTQGMEKFLRMKDEGERFPRRLAVRFTKSTPDAIKLQCLPDRAGALCLIDRSMLHRRKGIIRCACIFGASA